MSIFSQKTYFITIKSILIVLFLSCFLGYSQQKKSKSKFKVIAFYTAKNDQAHISFVHEANKWFPKIAEENHFEYDSTNNWDNLNAKFLAKYQVVLFLDTRPETPSQQEAFQKYMENGGGFIGFHFSAFALNDSDYPQNWNWYHNTFLGSGEYGSNTWRPTSAVLRVENQHPVTKNIPKTFSSAPNEWYRWTNDLTKNPDIKILLAIDESSFPLGTGPKEHEIWRSGYYPVVWTNKNYKMLYVNMGHNDIDYEHGTNKTLSYTFENKVQSQLILNALLWLGNSKK
ncbi:trehalose utilization protein [Flavobacterium sp. 90]|uniref:ThuA domain-containing protein n=1 Tax=unclassified Flavobacterium TaxID=196869 RepID=UPI000EAE57BC|nr:MULTISPECIES: ThuA domain-containing protein [unclassified Flavobacterium]RKR08211.1 trehalose utilization protein [Flavobacterium sp. 81]TCK57402.1 trehalose utilization protein [Flavobacterium sp. 90]